MSEQNTGNPPGIRTVTTDEAGIGVAIQALEQGGTMVYPTDTLYGLGAAIRNRDAVLRTFSIKNMEPAPQSLIMADHEMAAEYVLLGPLVRKFLKAFPQGPYTLISPVRDDALDRIPPMLVKDGMVGFRFPDHQFSRTIARGVGPITSTSANHHGDRPPKAINEVRLSGVDIYVDGGPCIHGEPSTILMEEGDLLVIVRHGALNEDVIRRSLGDQIG